MILKTYGISLLLILLAHTNVFSQAQIFDVKSDGLKEKDGRYFFENDTLRIDYAFWADKGVMAFRIINKLNKPIYIDWAKSSFNDLSNKLDYKNDDTTKNYSAYTYTGQPDDTWFGTQTGINSLPKVMSNERITFIPPKGVYYTYNRLQFHLLPISYFTVDGKCDRRYDDSFIQPGKKVLVLFREFSKKETPVRFRNFLTYSTDEKCSLTATLSHEFFVSSFSEMDIKNFKGQVIGQTPAGTPDYAWPLRKNTAFYILYEGK